MENSIVDKILDECSQIRILVVGSSRGKAQLIREVFGVNRVTRYPADFSRDEEIYSKENEYFVAHVFDHWSGVSEVLRRRRRGEPDEVIHCIWHYVDSQDVLQLTGEEKGDQNCPDEVRRLGIPIITCFGRFDNIVSRSSEIGRKRRLNQPLTEADVTDGKRVRKIAEAINLYYLQYPGTIAITSKAPSSKLNFLNVMLAALKPRTDLQMLLIIAQRLNPSLKFETAMNLAMKQFLLGTISTASPLPIPFAGLIGSQAATYMIKEDIIRVWNIHDPDYLCAGAQGQSSLMDNLLGIPVYGIKRVVYALPVIAQIKGVWETPRIAKALGGLMIDLNLLMERAYLATMGGIADGSSPARTPQPRGLVNTGSPRTPIRPLDRSQFSKDGLQKTPYSAEVLRTRKQLMSPLNSQFSPTSSITGTPPRTPARPSDTISLIDLSGDSEKDSPAPPTPRRPGTSPAPFTPSSKPELPPKPPRRPTTAPSTPIIATPLSHPPRTRETTPNAGTGVQALSISTPKHHASLDVTIRPASLPLTERMLKTIASEYQPIKSLVADELKEFFNQEGEGLQRSFQKEKVRRLLDEIVHRYRISQVVELI